MSHVDHPNVASGAMPIVVPPTMPEAPAAITFYTRDESTPLAVPAWALSHQGFRAWALTEQFPERGRITFVAGEIIADMSPENFEEHATTKTEIARVIGQLVRDQRQGYLCIDKTLVSNVAAGVSNEPDLVYISKDALKSGRVAKTEAVDRPGTHREFVGSVDWVVEIVSISSIKKDKIKLRKAYFEAGFGEYWIVDALADDVELEILVPGDGQYVASRREGEWQYSPTFGRWARLTRRHDDCDFWEYTLDMKETPSA